jgi:hypothetical protein
MTGKDQDIDAIRQKMDSAKESVLGLPNVVGIGVGLKRIRGKPTGQFIGLYFAGSNYVSFSNRIQNLFEALRFGDPRLIPGWFGTENQRKGGNRAIKFFLFFASLSWEPPSAARASGCGVPIDRDFRNRNACMNSAHDGAGVDEPPR